MQLEIKCCQPWKLQILSPQQTGAMPFQRGSPFQTPKEAVHLRVHFPPSQTKRKLNSETLLKLIGCPCTPNKNLCTSSGIFCFSQWVPWLVVVMGSSHQAYRTSRSQPWEVVEKHLEKEKGLIKHDWIVQVFLQIVLYHKYMLYIYILYTCFGCLITYMILWRIGFWHIFSDSNARWCIQSSYVFMIYWTMFIFHLKMHVLTNKTWITVNDNRPLNPTSSFSASQHLQDSFMVSHVTSPWHPKPFFGSPSPTTSC